MIQKRVTRDASTTDISNMAYDAAGNLAKFQDENATARGDTINIYTYSYDLMNRLTSMIYPNGLCENTAYDAAGNVAIYTNRTGVIKTFSQFDNRNRSHYFSWNDGVTPWQSTDYDDASRVKQVANSVSTINRTYLDDNRLKTEEEWTSVFNDNVHRTVTYTYDVDGNRLTVQYPSGTAFNYAYTNRNQVASIKPGLSGGTAVVSYGYDPSGNITSRTLDNGTSTAYTVDAVNRDTAVAHNLLPTGTTKRFDYAYNTVNDVLAVRRDSGLGDVYEYDLTQEIKRYAQDGAVDLTNGTIATPATDTNLTFDGCGNQTSLNGGGTFVANNLNEYTTFNGSPLTYDNDGDLLTYNGWTYTYDAQNRLTSAANGTVTTSFYYDGMNRQIARSINGTITFSVWDGDWAVLEEYGTSNTVTQKYLQGYHGLVKTLQDNIYYYQDELGSTSHIASASGALLEYYKYDLYGKPTYWSTANSQLPSSSYNVRDLFTGQRWIVELGLYDDRNRFMSPDLGRFIQPDPIGFKGDGSNLYRYCGNDWANRTDPMGLVGQDVDPADNNLFSQTLQNIKLGDVKLETRLKQQTAQNLSYGYWRVDPKLSPARQSYMKEKIDLARKRNQLINDKFAQWERNTKVMNTITFADNPKNPGPTLKDGAKGNSTDYSSFSDRLKGIGNATIFWNPDKWQTLSLGPRDPIIGLAHELPHADQINNGTFASRFPITPEGIAGERGAVQFENKVRRDVDGSHRSEEFPFDTVTYPPGP